MMVVDRQIENTPVNDPSSATAPGASPDSTTCASMPKLCM
jgi:hypothetical protein